MKPLTLKILFLILTALLPVLILSKFNSRKTDSAGPILNSEIGINVAPIKLADRQIDFMHTDNNEGENIIIKTDKKYYKGNSWADVYISVTNITDTSQNAALLFYFLKEKNQDNMITLQRLDQDEWQYLTFYKDNLKINVPKLDIALSKRETMPDTFEVRSGSQFSIPAGKTVYLLARLEYLPETEGEFWVETLGDKGAYGLLDPQYGTSASADTYASWYSNNWTYRRKISINSDQVSGSATLSDFPVLINITNSDIRHTSFGGKVASSSAGITGGGGDFVFTSSDGITKLDHEIEKYASSSGELWAWVEVASLLATEDTDLYMYYGGPNTGSTNQNKTGTWNSGYVGVWHMNENPAVVNCPSNSEICNSTSTSSINGNSSAGMTAGDSVTGKITNALDFDGNGNDEVIVTANAAFNTANVTASLWINGPSQVEFRYFLSKGANACDTASYGMRTPGGGGQGLEFFMSHSESGSDEEITLAGGVLNDSWRHVVGVFDDDNDFIGLYIDGTLIDSNTTIESIDHTSITNNNVGFGNYLGTCNLNSIVNMDEIKISNVARTADWIKTEYNNQVSPQSFYAVGGAQSQTLSNPPLLIKGGVMIGRVGLSAPISFVQATDVAQTSNASSITTTGITTTSGNSIICVGVQYDDVGTLGITFADDSKGNTFTEVQETVDSDDPQRIAIAHAHNITGGSGHTFTINFPTNSWGSLSCLEYSGLANETAESVTGGEVDAFSTIDCGPLSYTTRSVLVAAMTHQSSATLTPEGAPWIQRAEEENGDNGQPQNVIDHITTSGTSDTADWTMSPPVDAIAACAAYKD